MSRSLEKGTEQALILTQRYFIISAAIAPLEMQSALRRLQAERRLSAKALKATLKRIQMERAKWDLVTISADVLSAAERLTVDLNIRSLDAIHLACGMACQSRLRHSLPFITASSRQRDAANELGLETISVEL